MPEYDAYSVYYDLLWTNKQDDVPFYLDMAKETGGPVLGLARDCGRAPRGAEVLTTGQNFMRMV